MHYENWRMLNIVEQMNTTDQEEKLPKNPLKQYITYQNKAVAIAFFPPSVNITLI